ncbi:hypothetical protein C8J57DRAFT_1284398 [Mycena rebaudengoi]|nr:hypothetical protein C8J57DRAFT_1284398 [Mycena rebaudengoi]
MSESVHPWITNYLVQVAENFGEKLSAVPLEPKAKKVQILEFLGPGTENEDSVVWARISDKHLALPVKFSKDAVAECNRCTGRRITEAKTALVSIKKFRPVSMRVPSRNRGMSAEPQLALLCDSVTVIGSLGDSQWGSPRDIDANPDLREWSIGLRQDGGAGNVLKERKKAREDNTIKTSPSVKTGSPQRVRKMVATQGRAREPELMTAYQARWKASTDLPEGYFLRPRVPPPQPDEPATPPRRTPGMYFTICNRRIVYALHGVRSRQSNKQVDARDLGGSSPSQKYSPSQKGSSQEDSPKSSRSSTPISCWSSSPARAQPEAEDVASSPRLLPPSLPPSSPPKPLSPLLPSRTPFSPPPNPPLSSPAKPFEGSSSHLTAPTPAQRRLPTSSHLSTPTPAQRPLNVSPQVIRPIKRRVARPPEPPVEPVGPGPARILVPNSDTSQSQSQSQPGETQILAPNSDVSQSQEAQPQLVDESPALFLQSQEAVLDEDDAQTEQRLFLKRRYSDVELDAPSTKKRRAGFWLDYGEKPVNAIGWEQLYSVLSKY